MGPNDTRAKPRHKPLTRLESRRERLLNAMKSTAFVTDTFSGADDVTTKPEVRAQRLGVERAKELHYLQRYMPELPSVIVNAELHIQEIAEAHLADFEACSHYATQIDVVANKALSDRQSYNRYLQAFDDIIRECTDGIEQELERLRKISEHNLTESKRPVKSAFSIGTRRARQIHECYVRADLALRHGTFALIFGMIESDEFEKCKKRAVRSLRRMKWLLSNVKNDCFGEIAAQNKQALFTVANDAISHEQRIDPHADINDSIVQELAVIKPRPPRKRKRTGEV